MQLVAAILAMYSKERDTIHRVSRPCVIIVLRSCGLMNDFVADERHCVNSVSLKFEDEKKA